MKKDPFVLCLTNTVAANFTANVVLAIGAKPAMIQEPSEAAELAAVADAILVNVGTLTPSQAETMRAAVAVASGSVPWVLDPVGIQSLTYRREFVFELLNGKPSLIRGNHAEIDTLMGSVPSLKGSVPILSTGKVDKIWGTGPQIGPLEVQGGVPMLQQVTATGCAQGAICAVMLGRGLSPFDAAVQSSKLMKFAGQRAFDHAQAPGSFQIALIDALAELAFRTF